MKRAERQRQFVFAFVSLWGAADACNAEFNDRFAVAFARAGRRLHQVPKFFGAMPCPAALACLRSMHRDGLLQRRRVSLIEHAPGFPNWIHSYSLPAECRLPKTKAKAILNSYPKPPR